MSKKAGWSGDQKRHGLSSQGISSTKHLPTPVSPRPMTIPQPSFPVTDPNMMVKFSGMMQNLMSDNIQDPEKRDFENRSYNFAYDYIRGATKHYTQAERNRYFSNPNFIYYLDTAYLQNVTPDAMDKSKRGHFERNYKRGMKEMEGRVRKLTQAKERLEAKVKHDDGTKVIVKKDIWDVLKEKISSAFGMSQGVAGNEQKPVVGK